MSAAAAAVESIAAREILDSRGQPTIEAEAVLRGGARATAAAPAGASTGSREAKEARDGDERRFGGRGVLRAAANIENEIAPALRGMDARAQKKIDAALIELDGVADKSRLGANAVLAVSLAVAKAAAAAEGREFFAHIAAVFAPDFDLDSDSDSAAAASPRLPLPLLNVLNGGAHADNNLRVQEFMLAPAGFDSFAAALRAGVETFHALRRLLAARGLSTAVGDEGGFAPDLPDEESALELLTAAIEAAGYAPGRDIFLAIDCAASEFCENGRYLFRGDNLDSAAFSATLQKWRARYPLFSIEDPLDEDDWDGWRALTARMGADAQLIGDDLFATDARALQTGIERGVGNAILLKPNQIGTISETAAAAALAKKSDFACVLSHRSGETGDDSIADLAVGFDAGQIKAGAPCRGERVAKYNRLLRIEARLAAGGRARFAGRDIMEKWRRNSS